MAANSSKHKWRFFRVGGVDQVEISRPEDLKALGELDQKLWVALACPVQGSEIDVKTLEAIDTDNDGRIRAPEIVAATAWACSVLKDPEVLFKQSSKLSLDAIDTSFDEGKHLVASAKRILTNLGKEDAKAISVEDTSDMVKVFAETRFNGDGIVPVAAAQDEDLQKTLAEIIDCMGAEQDRSGKDGVSEAKAKAFFEEADAHLAWWKAADDAADEVTPIGEGTAAAMDAVNAVADKVDDYFTRCRLAAFDARSTAAMNGDEAGYKALATSVLKSNVEAIADLPLAQVAPQKALPLREGLNPAWSDKIATLRSAAVTPLLGDKDALSLADWDALRQKLAGHAAWLGKKAGLAVEKLGRARLTEIVAADAQAKIAVLIAEDKALEPEANAIASVAKIVHLNRDLVTLLHNFVTFRDFYSRKKKAIFQVGTLYLDGRSCELCVRVEDPAAHATLGLLSKAYLAYCSCTRRGTTEKMTIVAAFTDGDSDALMVGRNGLFYDRKGHDWDATIIKVVEQPISVRQAFWAPYKRVGKLIGEQIEKFASSRDKEMQDKAAANVAETGSAAEKPAAAAPPAAFDVAKFAGVFAAIGLALGALGSILAAVVTGFLSLEWWQMPLALVGVLLLVSGPSMLIAWLKLRKRSLGPILDATGWAVNAQARLNVAFGKSLTRVAALPEGAERSLVDPFADKKTRWPWLLLILVALVVAAWKLGYLAMWIARLRA